MYLPSFDEEQLQAKLSSLLKQLFIMTSQLTPVNPFLHMTSQNSPPKPSLHSHL